MCIASKWWCIAAACGSILGRPGSVLSIYSSCSRGILYLCAAHRMSAHHTFCGQYNSMLLLLSKQHRRPFRCPLYIENGHHRSAALAHQGGLWVEWGATIPFTNLIFWKINKSWVDLCCCKTLVTHICTSQITSVTELRRSEIPPAHRKYCKSLVLKGGNSNEGQFTPFLGKNMLSCSTWSFNLLVNDNNIMA